MTKLIASALAALALIACSDGTGQPASAGSAPGASDPTPTTTAGRPDDPAKSTDRRTPTTFEACEGYWFCPYWPDRWMRPEGDACLFGTEAKLFADGRLEDRELQATWEGDAFYVTFTFEDGTTLDCKRLPDEPSR